MAAVTDTDKRVRERERKAAYRARKRAESPVAVAPVRAIDSGQRRQARASATTLHQSVVDAVQTELAVLPLAEKRPADAAAALAMARILDDESSVPQQASAAKQLQVLMTGLRQEVEGGKSKLATLRAGREGRERGA